jgi:hypothetical protein
MPLVHGSLEQHPRKLPAVQTYHCLLPVQVFAARGNRSFRSSDILRYGFQFKMPRDPRTKALKLQVCELGQLSTTGIERARPLDENSRLFDNFDPKSPQESNGKDLTDIADAGIHNFSGGGHRRPGPSSSKKSVIRLFVDHGW